MRRGHAERYYSARVLDGALIVKMVLCAYRYIRTAGAARLAATWNFA